MRLLLVFLFVCLALVALAAWLLFGPSLPGNSVERTPAWTSRSGGLPPPSPAERALGTEDDFAPHVATTPPGGERGVAIELSGPALPAPDLPAGNGVLDVAAADGGAGSYGRSEVEAVRWAGDQAAREAEQRLAAAQAALADDPWHPTALRDEAAALVRLCRWSEAAQALARLLELHPDDDDLRFELATVLMRQRRFSAAVQVLKELVTRRPDDARSWFNLAVAGQALGHLSAARQAWDRVIELRPSAEAYARRGEVLLDLREWAAAAADFQAALTGQPESVDVALNLATALVHLERREEARTRLLAVIARHPRHVPALNRLAELAWSVAQADPEKSLDKCREAAEWCRRSLEIDPEQPAIRELLASVQAAGRDAQRGE